jgi:CheY-like chemotaxis protein
MPAFRAKILIIEDQADVLSYLSNLLRLQCFEILTATGAAEGIAAARSRRPDLVVLDAMLPGDAAERVYAALKGAPEAAPIPVILLSTLTRRTRGGSCLCTAGWSLKPLPEPDALLPKPPEADDFLAAVKRLTAPAPSAGEKEVP